jgi:hypothetical protein
MKLTAKQEMFVKEYLVDLNATQAAIRAEYSQKTPEGFYVYLLCDPRDGRIIYVGKGKGNRYLQHAKNAKAGKIDNAPKFKAINEILSSGLNLYEFIFESNLAEHEAFAIERNLIGVLKNQGITNIVNGSVSNTELIMTQAQEMLSRLKPYNVWVIEFQGYWREASERCLGDLEKFYIKFKKDLEVLANVQSNR